MPTEFKQLTVSCPACGSEGILPIFEMLDLDESSESTRAMVLANKVFTFTCPECEHREPVSYPMMCFDLEATGAIIAVLDEDDKAESYKRIYTTYESIDRDQDSRLRICDTTQEVSEKIRIFEDNMDDRIVELMKMVVRSLIADDVESYSEVKCTYKLTSNGKVIFSTRFDGEQFDVDLPTSVYADIERTFTRLPGERTLKDAYMINYTWADKMVAAMSEMARAADNDEDE